MRPVIRKSTVPPLRLSAADRAGDAGPQTKRDPAPSKLIYRWQRLWLTPLFRTALRAGLPSAAILAVGAWFLTDEAWVDGLRLRVSEARASIEERPEFRVNLMRIEDVSAEVAEDIREVTSLDFPVSSFDLDLEELRARIEELDAVAQSRLRIRKGGILEVNVVERVPAIVWRSREALELLDENGHRVAALGSRLDRRDLPLIAGDAADKAVPEALALMAAGVPIRARIRGFLRVGERRWDLILDNGQRIMLPEEGAVAALERVLFLEEIGDMLRRDVTVIDMRDQRRPTLRISRDAMSFLLDKMPMAQAEDGGI